MAAPSDVRTVIVRTGIVLARDGGALGKMLPVFQLFAGRYSMNHHPLAVNAVPQSEEAIFGYYGASP